MARPGCFKGLSSFLSLVSLRTLLVVHALTFKQRMMMKNRSGNPSIHCLVLL